jgi:hypothetical protein
VASVRRFGVLGLAVCMGLAVAPAPASAVTHPFLETFGSVEQPSFGKPMGLAVDQSNGDLLVTDVEAKMISRFKPNGTPDTFSALSGNVIDGKTGADDTPQHGLSFGFGNPREVQLAVDNSGGPTDGDIYVTQRGEHLVDIFAETGAYLGQLTASSEGPFGSTGVAGVAVDPAGAVYVSEFNGKGEIHKYVPAANPATNADNVANFERPSFGRLAAGAGPTAGFLFADSFNSEPIKLDEATGAEKYVVTHGEAITLALNPTSGRLYSGTESQVQEYDASGPTEAKLVSSFSPGAGITGLAVNKTTGNIYVSREGNPHIEVWATIAGPEVLTEKANPVGPHSATLHGTVSTAGTKPANALTDCHFEYVTKVAFEHSGFEDLGSGGEAPCVPAAGSIPNDGAPHPVSAEIENLSVATDYVFRLVAENGNGSSPEPGTKTGAVGLLTLGPVIGEESASQVTATGARIAGLIDPNTETTVFQVEYISEAKFAESGYAEASVVPAVAREVGSGTKFIEVAQQLGELTPSTTYHFRLLASNASATLQGADETFTTFALPDEALPDHRAYEMVSPAQKAGEVIPPEPASNLGGSCSECLPGRNTLTMPMQSAPDGQSVLYEGQPFSGGLAAGPNEYISGRESGGWGTQSQSPPVMSGRYEAFSADLSRAVALQESPALSSAAPSREGRSYPNLYLRQEGGVFQPLVSAEPPNRSPFLFQIRYAGANAGVPSAPAFSHLAFEANDALTEGVAGIAPAAPEVGGGQCTALGANCNLYEWSGQLKLVNVLTGNAKAAINSVFGSGRLLADTNADFIAPDVDHAISADGARIFWSSEETGEVYARIDGETSFEVKAPGPGKCKKSVPIAERVCFLTASADGSKVLLSDGGIYGLDEEAEAYEPSADLTEGKGGFRGILGASEDLSRVYFVDTEALTPPGEENGNPVHPEHAEKGALNLYAWHEGTTAFIGALNGSDNGFGTQSRYGDWKASRPNRTAQVSPDGLHLAFMSLAPLSGYDNARRGGGECTLGLGPSCFEVFEYTAESGTLVCASCNPSGQRPIGSSNLSLLRPENAPFPQPGNLSTQGEGRLFFESQDAISPQDTNGSTQDVYEWEPNEVGTCETPGGCVSLISSGQGANDSMFLDSTPSGNDAFFITRQQLLARDKDQRLDLYDARVGGGFEEPKTTPCSGEACKGPIPGPAPEQGPASPGLAGEAPKPKPCKPGFVRKNGKCVKKHHPHKRAARHAHGGGK